MFYLVYNNTAEEFQVLTEKKYMYLKDDLELIEFSRNQTELFNKLDLLEQTIY